MKVHSFCFLLFTFSFIFTSYCQEKGHSHKFEILTYGLRKNDVHQDAENIVAERWNILFKSIATCLISPQLKDSAEAFNHHTDSLISLRYGKKWRKKFERQIKTEEKLIERFIAQIKELDCISKLDSTLAKEGHDIYFMTYPYSISHSEKRYEVFIYGLGTIDSKTDLVCYYKFKLHKNRKTVELVTDKPSFLYSETP